MYLDVRLSVWTAPTRNLPTQASKRVPCFGWWRSALLLAVFLWRGDSGRWPVDNHDADLAFPIVLQHGNPDFGESRTYSVFHHVVGFPTPFERSPDPKP
jgi:hypothetical protein